MGDHGPLTLMSSGGLPSTPASANSGPLCRHQSAGRDGARLGTRSFSTRRSTAARLAASSRAAPTKGRGWPMVSTDHEWLQRVESRCGAVAVGWACLFPPLSSGGALLVARPWLRFHTHRVTGSGHPLPVPTERGVRISRTNALRQLLHSTASACSSEYGRRSLGGSNGVRSLIWLKASQVRRRPAQLRLHNIRRQ